MLRGERTWKLKSGWFMSCRLLCVSSECSVRSGQLCVFSQKHDCKQLEGKVLPAPPCPLLIRDWSPLLLSRTCRTVSVQARKHISTCFEAELWRDMVV